MLLPCITNNNLLKSRPLTPLHHKFPSHIHTSSNLNFPIPFPFLSQFALFVILASSVASTRINRSLLSKATRKLEDEEDDDNSILLGVS